VSDFVRAALDPHHALYPPAPRAKLAHIYDDRVQSTPAIVWRHLNAPQSQGRKSWISEGKLPLTNATLEVNISHLVMIPTNGHHYRSRTESLGAASEGIGAFGGDEQMETTVIGSERSDVRKWFRPVCEVDTGKPDGSTSPVTDNPRDQQSKSYDRIALRPSARLGTDRHAFHAKKLLKTGVTMRVPEFVAAPPYAWTAIP
jgi:hypothetical protein